MVERLLKLLYDPYLSSISAFGPRQFAHTLGRGARDALAILALTWVKALGTGRRIGVYCSDVSGAFDRVRSERLLAKMRAKRVQPKIVAIIGSWLRQRTVHVVVGGEHSDALALLNMEYQGTVLGPLLWNIFYEDARSAITEMSFTEIAYADDLNSYRVFGNGMENSRIFTSIDLCQEELHKWGRANQVSFDPCKESKHILSQTEPEGPSFKLLGISFDTQLLMGDAVDEVINSATWKLRTLLRTRRFYTTADMVILYKTHVLPYLEGLCKTKVCGQILGRKAQVSLEVCNTGTRRQS